MRRAVKDGYCKQHQPKGATTMTQTNTRKGDNQMTQLRAEQIAADHYCDYDGVEFYADGRKWIVRGHDCYGRVVEIVA